MALYSGYSGLNSGFSGLGSNTRLYSGNPGLQGGVNSGFLPTNLTNLALWLDASDTASITHVAGAVSQWNDKSGNNNHALQSSAAAKPTTGTRTQNGLNVIDFDGSGDFIDLYVCCPDGRFRS